MDSKFPNNDNPVDGHLEEKQPVSAPSSPVKTTTQRVPSLQAINEASLKTHDAISEQNGEDGKRRPRRAPTSEYILLDTFEKNNSIFSADREERSSIASETKSKFDGPSPFIVDLGGKFNRPGLAETKKRSSSNSGLNQPLIMGERSGGGGDHPSSANQPGASQLSIDMKYSKRQQSSSQGINLNVRAPNTGSKVGFWARMFGKQAPEPRTFPLTEHGVVGYAPNIIRNQKYHVYSFIFVVLFNQFKYFFNLVFLVISLSQLFPALRVNSLFTNLAPLCLVLTITIVKEAYDDYKRYLRDKDANSQKYQKLTLSGTVATPSSDIKVGDVVILEKDQRVPADMVLLRTTEKTGGIFIRTDQLDGEIDWKVRNAVSYTQKLASDYEVFHINGQIFADKPHKDIHTFVGTFTHDTLDGSTTEPLTVENTLWMNTVIASGNAVGVVIYTGTDTRAVMNTSRPKSKSGLIDMELNTMSKVLGLIVVALAFSLVSLKGLHGAWLVYFFRFIVLFSTIIPLSLRVNLDMGKTFYSSDIMDDEKLPGVIVRTSTIPEELGRIGYLLSDKTGTLTKNDMELKKIHLGTMAYGSDSRNEVKILINESLGQQQATASSADGASTSIAAKRRTGGAQTQRGKRDISSRLLDTVQALALCHNVTPVIEEDGQVSYQASSPDEVAIVKWTETVGLTLIYRDREILRLQSDYGRLEFDILHVFPFTSETKRMGIIVRDRVTNEIIFYEKGADMMMAKIVQQNDWLDEESGNMAREGLRTLAIGRKRLTNEQYAAFDSAYMEARIAVSNRAAAMQLIVETLERDLELLALTGVEDKLQDNVKMTLELLRQAEIKIWMLTGDKIETATNIAISTRLFSRNQKIHTIQKLSGDDPRGATEELSFLRGKPEMGLVIDGPSLYALMEGPLRADFVEISKNLPAVVCCRCTPTQKADIAKMIKGVTRKRVACIGDGGNDVSMIQAADVGVGIVGKEGRQASLAADFSVVKFSQLTRLILWHGRNSYKRTAKLSLFVIHRGFVIAVLQSVFSAIFYFAPIALYQGWIAVGYTTVYTMWPVFSLVLDRDVTEEVALLYPELYKDLTKGRELSFKEFFKWLSISVFQGGVIMLMAIWLFERDFIHIVSITFTSLILNELLMVALEVNTWHYLMGVAEIGSFLMYVISVRVLKTSFDVKFTTSWTFFWKVGLITLATFFPLYAFKIVKHIVNPPSSAKLQE